MEDLVKYIVTALVSKPDEVEIKRVDSEDGCVIEVHVAHDDMGKIIGRQGRIARAIRTVVKSAAAGQNKKVTVEIV